MYIEGEEFDLIPDIEAAKNNDPYPWRIRFLDRVIKVHSVRIPDDDDDPKLTIDIDYISGEQFNDEEVQNFGDLIKQLIMQMIQHENNKDD